MQRLGRIGLFLTLAGALALSAGAARAFTFTDQNGNTGAAQGYLDLDTKSSQTDPATARFGNGSSTNSVPLGNGTLQFGSQSNSSSSLHYNTDRLFNPFCREGRC